MNGRAGELIISTATEIKHVEGSRATDSGRDGNCCSGFSLVILEWQAVEFILVVHCSKLMIIICDMDGAFIIDK